MTVVLFDPAAFIVRYPEFAAKDPAYLTVCFNEASIICNNTDRSIVQNIPTRTALLWALTAHIVALSDPTRNGLVGRVGSAGEGSVNVSMVMATATEASQWYMQTPYGASFWNMSKPYRSALYFPPPTRPRMFMGED